MNRIEYGGIKYYRQSSGRYYQSGNRKDKERLLHRRIWSDEHGEIPQGCAIHHVDGDWKNNELSNLVCIAITEHARQHMQERLNGPGAMERQRELQDMAQRAAKSWHSSPEGLAWHKEHGQKTFGAPRFSTVAECECCGVRFMTKAANLARFCSSACTQKVARVGYNTLEKVCERCDTAFLTNRYRPRRFCGYSCSNAGRKRGFAAKET